MSIIQKIRISLCCYALTAALIGAAEVRVAVAGNFSPTLAQIAERYSAEKGVQVRLSSASTGKLYAQIVNGAPYDLFFAADVLRPQRLEEQGIGQDGSRYTYAFGRLALWSTELKFKDTQILKSRKAYRHLALANPQHSPYGQASMAFLERIFSKNRGLEAWLEGKIVLGENISQVFSFVSSGNAQLGFVAASQLVRSGQEQTGNSIILSAAEAPLITQQALLLGNTKEAVDFWWYMRSDSARALIAAQGYILP